MERIRRIFGIRGFRENGAYVLGDIRSITEEEIRSLLPVIPPWRLEKARSFKKEADKRESVLSFALLMWALYRECGVTEPVEFGYLPGGKPFLKDRPGIHFNISHCREAVACVVARDPVGVDVERRGRYGDTLARATMNEGELSRIGEAEDADLEFTRLWTRKEALLKLTGEGVGKDMKNVIPGHPEITLRTFDRDSFVCSVAGV